MAARTLEAMGCPPLGTLLVACGIPESGGAAGDPETEPFVGLGAAATTAGLEAKEGNSSSTLTLTLPLLLSVTEVAVNT